MAHLGGVGCGLLFAVPMVPRLGAPRTLFDRRLRIAVVMTVTILVLFGFFLAQLPKLVCRARSFPGLCNNGLVTRIPAGFQARSNSHFS